MTYTVSGGALNSTQSNQFISTFVFHLLLSADEKQSLEAHHFLCLPFKVLTEETWHCICFKSLACFVISDHVGIITYLISQLQPLAAGLC